MTYARLLPLILVASAAVLAGGPVPVAQAAPFPLNSTGDPGDGVCDETECTLREASGAANALPGADAIAFDIPGAGPHTIQPSSSLPTVTDPVVIDGSTQPGFAGTPIVELDGSGGGGGDGLSITAGNSVVRGLAINRFGVTQFNAGIELLSGGGNVVEGNYLGTDVTGAIDFGNGTGVSLLNSSNNLI